MIDDDAATSNGFQLLVLNRLFELAILDICDVFILLPPLQVPAPPLLMEGFGMEGIKYTAKHFGVALQWSNHVDSVLAMME